MVINDFRGRILKLESCQNDLVLWKIHKKGSGVPYKDEIKKSTGSTVCMPYYIYISTDNSPCIENLTVFSKLRIMFCLKNHIEIIKRLIHKSCPIIKILMFSCQIWFFLK